MKRPSREAALPRPVRDAAPAGESRPRPVRDHAAELRQQRLRTISLRIAVLIVVTAGLLGLWILLASRTSPTILPGPDSVWQRFTLSLSDGTYFPALFTTAEEAGWAGWSPR